MKKILFCVIAFMITLAMGVTRIIYQEVRIFDLSPATLRQLHVIGIPLDHVQVVKGRYMDVVASENQVKVLSEIEIPFSILIDNLGAYAVERSIPAVEREIPLGSMLGNYTLTEAIARMDSLALQYPDRISAKTSIGLSIEGRDIWAFKVSDNPNFDENEPEVLFTGLTHAREPLGMMNLFYFVQTLCEDYGTDEEITFLVENREMWFVPILNPDGYVYNESVWNTFSEPGYHRKNRRDTGCGSETNRGVDLNRNYSFAWGADDIGSSSNPCSETFRGDSAFSEPETAALREFVLLHEFQNILHYHAHGNVLLHSFGDGSLPPEPDLTTLQEIGIEMTDDNHYPVGTGTALLGYAVNGDAVDWSYGAQGLISYTPEIGTNQDHFWPSENRVITLCQDQFYQNKMFAFVAGSDPFLRDYSMSEANPGANDTVTVSLVIQNRGLHPSNGPVSIDIIPHDSLLAVLELPNSNTEFAAREIDTLDMSFTIAYSAQQNMVTGLRVVVNDSLSFPRDSTITFQLGEPNYLLGDLVADRRLDIHDVLALVNILLSEDVMYDYQQVVANVHPGDTIDIYDLMALIDLIMVY